MIRHGIRLRPRSYPALSINRPERPPLHDIYWLSGSELIFDGMVGALQSTSPVKGDWANIALQ